MIHIINNYRPILCNKLLKRNYSFHTPKYSIIKRVLIPAIYRKEREYFKFRTHKLLFKHKLFVNPTFYVSYTGKLYAQLLNILLTINLQNPDTNILNIKNNIIVDTTNDNNEEHLFEVNQFFISHNEYYYDTNNKLLLYKLVENIYNLFNYYDERVYNEVIIIFGRLSLDNNFLIQNILMLLEISLGFVRNKHCNYEKSNFCDMLDTIINNIIINLFNKHAKEIKYSDEYYHIFARLNRSIWYYHNFVETYDDLSQIIIHFIPNNPIIFR